jgi:hypothetical protein
MGKRFAGNCWQSPANVDNRGDIGENSTMKYALFLLCLAPLLFGCNSYEQENNRFKEEIKMLTEENNYAKAEIIGLKKELAELSARVKDEREASQRKLDEERGLMQKKIEEIRETTQKKAEADKKKGMAGNKEQANSGAAKKPLPPSGAGTVKKDQPQKSAGSGGKEAKEAGTKPGAQKARDSKKPASESPGEE